MRALIAGGANPAISLPDGTTALMAAAGLKEGTSRDADRRGVFLIDGGKLPAEGRIADAVSVALLDSGDINAVNRSGDTAAHAAVSMGLPSSSACFLTLKLAPFSGLTPLAALAGRNARMADLLRKLGALD
jgi:hypothetical protein